MKPPTIMLDAPSVRVGAGPENDVPLDLPGVQREHLEFRSNGGEARFTVAPGAEVRLNGQIVAGAVLREGDIVDIGTESWVALGFALVPCRRDRAPLRVQGATFVAGEDVLLRPVDLVVAEGEMVAIIGPSGAGKSTLLGLFAGLARPTSGRVLCHGHDVAVRQADVGYVPQADALHRLLTPRETLDFACRLRGRHRDDEQRAEAVEDALRRVDLLEQADRRIDTLSGGQQKRVSVAQELTTDPVLLLLDEPTSGLDPGLERRLVHLLRDLARDRCAAVVVTHDLAHLDVCDRVVVMAPGGRVVAVGTPAKVLETTGAASFAELYEQLHDRPAPDDEPLPDPTEEAAPATAADRAQTTGRSIREQTRILARRHALLHVRDRRNLVILGGQAVLLGFAAALLFPAHVFSGEDGQFSHAGETAQLLFLMVTLSLWFGGICAARQIVGERAVVERDLDAGVRTEAYLASKALVLGAVSAAQTLAMAAVVFGLRPLDPPGSEVTVVAILILAAWAGVTLGLVVSAYARSEDQATSLIPLVLLPQLLFGGAIVTVADLSGLMAAVSQLAAAQWAFAGSGSAIDMNARIEGDPVYAPASRYGESFFALPPSIACLVLVGFVAIGAVVLQARLRPSFEGTWWQQARFRAGARRHVRAATTGATR
ncbi:MAG: ATP-binding cassette domain-containing protein [Solirubrobacteraceae bacterium]|nr:ATP-binding cassette domain-containing protein [Solirubrobacteraceae bacterium]